jgi:hypothetical protein
MTRKTTITHSVRALRKIGQLPVGRSSACNGTRPGEGKMGISFVIA